MKFYLRWVIGTIACTGAAASFFAYPQLPTFGQPPGMGRNMPGPPGRGLDDSWLGMLEMEEVRKEIKLEDAKKQQLESIQIEHRQAIEKAMGEMDFAALPEQDPSQRDVAFGRLRERTERIQRESDEKLRQMLSVPQKERLTQLHVRRKGIRAWAEKELHDQLHLTGSQRETLRGLLEPLGIAFQDSRSESEGPGWFGGLFGGPPRRPGGFGPPEFGPGGFGPSGPEGNLQSETESKILAMLDEKQKADWDKIAGETFSFPALPFRMGGGPMSETRPLVARFDKDGNERLERAERDEARAFLKTQPNRGPGGPGGFGGPRGPGGRGGPGGGGPGFGPPGFGPPGRRGTEATSPGPRISADDVKTYPEEPLYTDKAIRTLFLTFEENDWEEELADFNNTDVDVPADLLVDGKRYPRVGVHFRGMSSFGMVPAGSKRSLNLSLDFADQDQRLYGRKTLNLLNAHEDPSFLRTILYLEAAQKYALAPVANFVHVVINGESWGLYVNAEQFNKEFIEARFSDAKGARWKVPGSPGGRGGLEYFGDELDAYKRTYQIKSKDRKEDWVALIELCKTLNTTPVEDLPSKIEPMLNVEGVLHFLALDIGLVNSDGYWTRASDYSLYRDSQGVFHVAIHDANETLKPAMGPGMGGPGMGGPGMGGPGMGGPGRPNRGGGNRESGPRGGAMRSPVELDPLTGLDDSSKPLRSKLLAVPKYRARYLEILAKINEEILGGDFLQSRIEHYVPMIDPYVKQDTRKLESYEAFQKAVETDLSGRIDGRDMSILDFAKARYEYLKKALAAPTAAR
jgi:spore coat protein CotH